MTPRISTLLSAVALATALCGCSSTVPADYVYLAHFVAPRELLPTDIVEPPAVISSPIGRFGDELRAAGIRGQVTVRMIVGVDGRGSDFEALRSDHPRLSEAAFATLAGWRFSPAMVNGEPVAVYHIVTMSFRGGGK